MRSLNRDVAIVGDGGGQGPDGSDGLRLDSSPSRLDSNAPISLIIGLNVLSIVGVWFCSAWIRVQEGGGERWRSFWGTQGHYFFICKSIMSRLHL